MIGLLRSIITAAYLYFMRRRQYDNVRLRRFFGDRYNINVGMYSYGCFDRWRMPGPMRVGRYCSIAKTVRSSLVNHPLHGLTTHPILYDPVFGIVKKSVGQQEPLIIEDDVWIGHGVIITPACKLIGRGAVIGAGAVVTKDVEPYCIMAGNPARMLRARFEPHLIEAIEATRWWELDAADLRRLAQNQPDLVFNPSARSARAWLEGAPR